MTKLRIVALFVWLVVFIGCAAGNVEDQTAPTLPDDVYEEILTHYRNHQYDLVKQYISRCQESGVRDKRLYFLSGILALQSQSNEQAKTAFQQAIELDSEYSDAYNNLGVLYMADKEYAKAESSFHNALKNPLYRTPEIALVHLGKVMEVKDNSAAAEQYYRQAIKYKSGFVQAYHHLGMLFYHTDRFKQAVTVFDQAVKLAPRWAQVWLWYGMSLKRINENEKSRAAFEKVLELSPDTDVARQAELQLQGSPASETMQEKKRVK
ncbi:MAG: tetratricopeptide repeat protein [Pseudomonadota bacterium]|nr:tetratricopeptide repeat protein [Pseudomonadota bacterium]